MGKQLRMSDANKSQIEEYQDDSIIVQLRKVMTDVLEVALSEAPLMVGIATKIRERRQERLLDELAKGEKLLTDKEIHSHEFVSAFMIVHHVVLRTRREEKIQYFARLLLSGVEKSQLDSDEFDEFVNILDEISYREIQVLKLLKHFEDTIEPIIIDDGRTPPRLQNDVQKAKGFWSQFEQSILKQSAELDIYTADEITSMLVQLQRTGMYRPFHGHWGDENKHGETTVLFDRFLSWIEKEAD